MKMTKTQAEQLFKEEVLPSIKQAYEFDGIKDRVARREAWFNFTDMLCKDRQITQKQYDTWMCPRICE